MKAQSNTYLPGVLPVLSQPHVEDELDVQSAGVTAALMLLESGPDAIKQALEEKDEEGTTLIAKTLTRVQETFADNEDICQDCKVAQQLVTTGQVVMETMKLGELVDGIDFMDPTQSLLIVGAQRLMDTTEIIANGEVDGSAVFLSLSVPDTHSGC